MPAACQQGVRAAGVVRIAVHAGVNDARDSGVYQALRARRRAAVGGAGFERDVDRRAADDPCRRRPPAPRARRAAGRRRGASLFLTDMPSFTITAPTGGFGAVLPMPLRASSSARFIQRVSSVMSRR